MTGRVGIWKDVFRSCGRAPRYTTDMRILPTQTKPWLEWLKKTWMNPQETEDLLQETSRKIIFTTGFIYMVFHILATLFWAQLFSPSIWICTLLFILTFWLSISLLPHRFALAQMVWFIGLGLIILTLFELYQQPEILLILAILPMMSEVMTGLKGTIVVESGLLLLVVLLPELPFTQPVTQTYRTALLLISAAAGVLGWGLSDNLISATDAANYHYHEAVKRLEEARQHRAEISVLLNEKNKSNYQLNRLNKMLNTARIKADEARMERDRFAMAVSHELRSPLNFIIGFSDLMVNSPETYAALHRWPRGLYDDIQEIYRSSNHLLGLINDILDMGKIDAQQMILFREKVDLSALVDEVSQMVSGLVDKKGLWLKNDIESDLPPVFADRTRIRQVLLNLITNGLRFTDKGGLTIRLRREDEKTLRIEVEDTGIGIDRDNLEWVFEEFRQVGNENWRRTEGTGLGLSIGRRFIDLHGGKMGVESELGKGSLFYFTIPVMTPAAELELTAEDPSLGGDTARSRLRPADQDRLLIFLTQSPFWAKVFGQSLPGYQVLAFSSPKEMFAMVQKVFPRAVIIDDAFCDEQSVQLFVSQPPYDVPIITFSIPMTSYSTTGKLEGVLRYLVKPVSRNQLIEAVTALGPTIRNLLVVDDDPSMVRYLTQVIHSSEYELPARDYRFLTASTGEEALQHLAEGEVDAVLLDLDLPDINGLTLLNMIQKDDRLNQLPVVIISAQDLPGALFTPKSGSMQVRVNHPFAISELQTILEALLDKLGPGYQKAGQVDEDDLPEENSAQ